jgi:hypothetical protein
MCLRPAPLRGAREDREKPRHASMSPVLHLQRRTRRRVQQRREFSELVGREAARPSMSSPRSTTTSSVPPPVTRPRRPRAIERHLIADASAIQRRRAPPCRSARSRLTRHTSARAVPVGSGRQHLRGTLQERQRSIARDSDRPPTAARKSPRRPALRVGEDGLESIAARRTAPHLRGERICRMSAVTTPIAAGGERDCRRGRGPSGSRTVSAASG